METVSEFLERINVDCTDIGVRWEAELNGLRYRCWSGDALVGQVEVYRGGWAAYADGLSEECLDEEDGIQICNARLREACA